MVFKWFSDRFFTSKEVKAAMKEGREELKKAEALAKERSKEGKKELRDAMKEGKKLLKDESKQMEKLKKVAKEELKKVGPAEPLPPKEEAKWFASYKSEEQKEAEALKAIKKSFKGWQPDVFERQTENITELVSNMGKALGRSQRICTNVTQQVTAQQMELDRLATLISQLDEINKALADLSRGDLEFDKSRINQKIKLLKQLGSKEGEVMASFQKIITLAREGSQLRKDLDEMLQILSVVRVDAPIVTQQVLDDIEYARSLLRFEGAILSATKPALRAKAGEVEKLKIFLKSALERASR